jgi:hypothetical protein
MVIDERSDETWSPLFLSLSSHPCMHVIDNRHDPTIRLPVEESSTGTSTVESSSASAYFMYCRNQYVGSCGRVLVPTYIPTYNSLPCRTVHTVLYIHKHERSRYSERAFSLERYCTAPGELVQE